MKFSTTILAAVAPVAMARRVANVAPPPAGIVGRDVTETDLSERQVSIVPGTEGLGISTDARSEVIVIWVNPGNGAARTTVNDQVTVTRTVTAGAGGGATNAPGGNNAPGGTTTASAPGAGATHSVTVGGEGLTFKPDQLKAQVGDMVVFTMRSQNHSVTQSTFSEPCKAMAAGMDSGFLANPNNTVEPPPQVAVQVMTEEPLWFYCGQNTHCGKGMVFSLNPGINNTHAMFQATAIAQNGTGAATPITGGPPPEAAAPENAAPGNAAPGNAAPGGGAGVGGNSTQGVGGGAGGGSGATSGQGTVGADGSCECVVSCSSGAFPAAAQGVGAFGGMAGSFKMNDMK